MAISCVIILFFTGHMEYARLIIISFPVGDLSQSWLFHMLLICFLKVRWNTPYYHSRLVRLFLSSWGFHVLLFIFNGSDGIRHTIILGWWENLLMAISCVIILFFTGHMEYARLIIISFPVGDLSQSCLFHVLLICFLEVRWNY